MEPLELEGSLESNGTQSSHSHGAVAAQRGDMSGLGSPNWLWGWLG